MGGGLKVCPCKGERASLATRSPKTSEIIGMWISCVYDSIVNLARFAIYTRDLESGTVTLDLKIL